MELKILIDNKENNQSIITEIKKYIEIKRTGLLFGDYMIQVNSLTAPVIIKRLKNHDDFLKVLLDPTKDINNNNKFFKGLKRVTQNNKDVILLIEDEEFYKKLFSGPIRNKVIKLEILYPNMKIVPISETITAKYIYLTLIYRAKKFYSNL